MSFFYKVSFLKRSWRDHIAKRCHTNHSSFVLLSKTPFSLFAREMQEVMPSFSKQT